MKNILRTKLLGIILFVFFFSNDAKASCSTTISVATSAQLTCNVGDILNISSTGSIIRSGSKAVAANNGVGASSTTVINHGLISATNETINMKSASGTNKITNSGTINTAQNENDSNGTAVKVQKTDGTEIVNSGTIHGGNYAIQGLETDDITITNSGTISGNNGTAPAIYLTNGTNATITNTGTITNLRHGIRLGKAHGSFNNATIINSGLIAGTTHNNRNSIYVSDDNNVTSGFNLITKGEGRYDGKILLSDQNETTGETFFDFTLDCSISRDQTIEIHEKKNMRIINNLCGNDTYEILDSNLDPDPDNLETNGYLRIYGEDLDIDSHNQKHRTEIFITNLNNIFENLNNYNEKSIYFSKTKRNNIYTNTENGVTGYFENKIDEKFAPFISYSTQNVSFNNGEYINNDKLSLGFKHEVKYQDYKISFLPLIGISRNNITDVETETNQAIEKNSYSQLAAININTKKIKKFNDKNKLSIEVEGIYGIHRFSKYMSSFTDGDLTVDEAVDQVLGAGFTVKNSSQLKNGFVIEPYGKFSLNNTLSNDINITADGENKEAGHVMNGVLAKRAGINLSKNNDEVSFKLNIEHNNQDGLIGNLVNISVSKKLQRMAKIKREKEKPDPKLEKLFDQLVIAKENERLAKLAGNNLNENKILKEMIIQLIKENQKLKTVNKLLKNKVN